MNDISVAARSQWIVCNITQDRERTSAENNLRLR